MIGFVGLGLMGEGFTRRLIEKGHAVTGFDIDPEKTRAAAGWGVTPAASAAEVAQASDIVLICVINTAAVEDATLEPRGIASVNIAGKVIVDHSTTELDATQAYRGGSRRQRRAVRRCAGSRWPYRREGRHARHHGGRQRCGDREDLSP